ncbi:hypothetical protein ACQEU3_39270 [Spirillospora sp. CA-253888]
MTSLAFDAPVLDVGDSIIGYLTDNAARLHCGQTLERGWPIATRANEETVHCIVADRLGIAGAVRAGRSRGRAEGRRRPAGATTAKVSIDAATTASAQTIPALQPDQLCPRERIASIRNRIKR